jgi:hypothetical protein
VGLSGKSQGSVNLLEFTGGIEGTKSTLFDLFGHSLAPSLILTSVGKISLQTFSYLESFGLFLDGNKFRQLLHMLINSRDAIAANTFPSK